MACFHPLDAWQLETGEVVFAERGNVRRSLTLPCGQCIGCRLERSRQWAVRCMHESQMHELSSFVTLTYDDEHLPVHGSLRYRDFQLFMKRLRKRVGPVRFYMCGEYGEKRWRPHFHALLFGCFFEDRERWRESASGFPLYRSKVLESLWDLGTCEVGDVSFDSAAYVARYCMKKITGPNSDAHYERMDPATGELFWLEREFTRMSLKPGIGFKWFERFRSDVFTEDHVVVNGMKCKPPRYYDRLLALAPDSRSDEIEFSRYEKAMRCVDDCTVDRLRAREVVTRARLSFKVRSLEV